MKPFKLELKLLSLSIDDLLSDYPCQQISNQILMALRREIGLLAHILSTIDFKYKISSGEEPHKKIKKLNLFICWLLSFVFSQGSPTKLRSCIPGVPKKASPQIQNKKCFSQRVKVREWKKMSVVKVIDLRVIHLLRQ